MSFNVDLACIASAWVRKSEPNANYHGASIYPLAGPGTDQYYTYLLLKFEDLPQQYRYYSVIDAQYWLTINRNLGSARGLIGVDALRGDFDEQTVTYDQTPYFYYLDGGETPSQGSGDEQIHYIASVNNGNWGAAVAPVMAYRTAAVSMPSSWSSSDYFVKAYTEQAAAGKRPFLRLVMFDTPVRVNTTITAPSSTVRFDNTSPVTFSWEYSFSTSVSNPLAPIVQTGATIYWKLAGSEDPYNAVTVTGSAPSYTFPGGTFPTGQVVWYVEPTLEGYTGTASRSSSVFFRRFVRVPVLSLASIDSSYPDVNYPWPGYAEVSTVRDPPGPYFYRYLLAQFSEFPAEYGHTAIDRAAISLSTLIQAGKRQGVIATALLDRFDPRTVTWNKEPAKSAYSIGNRYDNTENDRSISIPDFQISSGLASEHPESWSYGAARMMSYPAYEFRASVTDPPGTFIRDSFFISEPLELIAQLLDQIVTSKPSALTNDSGYVNPHVAQVFRWQHVPDGDYWCVGGWNTVSATFYWSSDNGSTWNSVAVQANSSEMVLPAETLPTGTIMWYVTATDDQGTTASSDTYTISTADVSHTATPVYPNSSLENGDAPIRFIWTDASDTNTAPTGADLQYSTDGSTWTTFAQPRTSATEIDAPASTFPSGTVLWRVRSLNADGVAGAWSDPLSFVCFAAPDAPIISTNEKPLLTVTWQSEGQQAYKVIVDGKTYGPYFGTSKSFTVPDFLSDGTHTVAVSVQNEYSLWSLIDPENDAGTISVTVTNVPGEPVTLTGLFDRDAELSWSTTDATSDFLIYRDGVQIGHASGRSFTDRVVLGYHSWRVINRLPGGYYTASNVVSGTLMTGRLAIAPLSGGAWLELAKSENSARSVVWNELQLVALRQFAGQIYPQAEAAPYKTMSAGFDVAWTHAEAEQAAIFASLIGQSVIFKTPCEGAMVGILTAWQRNNMHFYRSYSATVQRIHWRDYVDADD